MKIKIKQLFDEITKQKVYPLTTFKAVKDPITKKSLAELLLVGEDVGETQDTPTKDADTLGGKYRASDIDKSMTYDEDESTEVVEGVEIVDADRLGGKYTANDIDVIKQDINGLNSSLSDVNMSLESINSRLEWKLLSEVKLGETVLLPSNYNEILCCCGGVNFSGIVNINIPSAVLTTSANSFSNGTSNSGSNGSIHVLVDITKTTLKYSRYRYNSESDVANAICKVFYR